VKANNSAASRPSRARKLGNVSIGVSVAGIVVAVIVIIVYYLVFVSCAYKYKGVCYNYKECVGSDGSCSGVKSHDSCCYHN